MPCAERSEDYEMIATIAQVLRGIREGLKNPEYRLFILAVIAVLGGGTLFYHFYEGWSWIDSIYFVVVALTTVGFGDFTPSTEFSRLITIGFVFFGVVLLGAFINLLVKQRRERQKRRHSQPDGGDVGSDQAD